MLIRDDCTVYTVYYSLDNILANWCIIHVLTDIV